MWVLTEKLILGMNALSLVGFALIAISLALARRSNLRARQRRIRVRIAVVLMIGGTALVCFGIYLTPPLIP
jgi:uncharacterized membrane protein